jgi:Sec-independent protein secretion pathway component TatC
MAKRDLAMTALDGVARVAVIVALVLFVAHFAVLYFAAYNGSSIATAEHTVRWAARGAVHYIRPDLYQMSQTLGVAMAATGVVGFVTVVPLLFLKHKRAGDFDG